MIIQTKEIGTLCLMKVTERQKNHNVSTFKGSVDVQTQMSKTKLNL